MPETQSQPARHPHHAAAFIFPVRVYYEDTDAAGVVYYANYLKFMERARTEWLRALGFEHGELIEQYGVVFVVRSLAAEYLKPARLNDLLQVEVAVAELKRSQIVFQQSVKLAQATLTTAAVNVVCVDAGSFKPLAIPRAVREKFSHPG